MDKVIIDGIDISGCMNYSFKEFINYTEYPDYCGEYLDNRCDNHPNCYYKQLKRLQAELQRYKDMEQKGLEEFKDIGGCWGCGIQESLNQAWADCKKYRAENEELKAKIYPQTNYTTQKFYTKEEYDKLQVENERLKQEVEDLNFYIDSYRQIWEVDKYRQALQEIRDMATLFHSVNENKGLDRFKNNIIDKINSVIGAEQIG